MSIINAKLRLIHDTVLVYGMHMGETKTAGGIIINSDDGKAHGVKPRWAKVYAKGHANTDEYSVGDWILIEHGRWTRKTKINDPELGEIEVQKVELTSILAWQVEEPNIAYIGKEYSNGSTASFDAGMFGAS